VTGAVTAWHAAQLDLFGLALAQLARTAHAIVWQGPSDTRALADAVAVAIRGHQSELARSIAGACLPAWSAQMLGAALEEQEGEGVRPWEAMDDVRGMLVGDQADRLRTLAAVGRIAGPLAFLAIVLELGAAFGPGHGLMALQRGLVQSIAVERAALSFAIGIATTLVSAGSAAFLRERLRSLSDELKRAREIATRALRADPDM
jgi:hypothetical protein